MREIKLLEGNLVASGLRLGIIAARFNEFISSKLVAGAIDAIIMHGGTEETVTVAWVPGAYEIQLAAQKMAASKKFDAVICLGAVIRESTPHFDYVCAEVSKGVAQVGL